MRDGYSGALFLAIRDSGLPQDPSEYSDADWQKYDEIVAKVKEEYKEEELSDSYYTITTTLSFPDGVEEVSTDIRTLSLEQLEKVIEVFPKYTAYYYERLAEKDSQ